MRHHLHAAVVQVPDALDGVAGDPALLALAAVALVAVLAGGAWWLRSRTRPAAGGLLKQLARPDAVAVLMHPRPDPDAMASAVAVKHLAEFAGTRATVQYPGEIRHPENRAFRTLLDLDLERIETDEDLAADDVVLVDHNRPRGFEGANGVTPFAVVDHHPGGGVGTAFTDVRTDVGATASILAAYFESLDAERVDEDDEETEGLALPADVATGLAYGVLSDTNNLTRGCSSTDFAAMEYLYPSLDDDLLDRIAHPEVDAEVLDVRSRAISRRDERPPYAVSDVGEVDALDAIPQAADELLDLEGVGAVVVVGEKDGRLHFSGRSRDDRVHMGRVLEVAVEGIPMAGAGGHARMGGGQVSLTHMSGLRPGSGLTREEFHERLFDAMAGQE